MDRMSLEVLEERIKHFERGGGCINTPVYLEMAETTPQPGNLPLRLWDLKIALEEAHVSQELRETIKELKEERAEVNKSVVDLGKEVEKLKEFIAFLPAKDEDGDIDSQDEIAFLTAQEKEDAYNIIDQIKESLTEIYDGSQSTM